MLLGVRGELSALVGPAGLENDVEADREELLVESDCCYALEKRVCLCVLC